MLQLSSRGASNLTSVELSGQNVAMVMEISERVEQTMNGRLVWQRLQIQIKNKSIQTNPCGLNNISRTSGLVLLVFYTNKQRNSKSSWSNNVL